MECSGGEREGGPTDQGKEGPLRHYFSRHHPCAYSPCCPPCLLPSFLPAARSLATVLTPAAARLGLPWLLAVRAGMGVGEGVALPAMNNAIARYVAPRYTVLQHYRSSV